MNIPREAALSVQTPHWAQVQHDLNNLMAIVLGNLELVVHNPLDAKAAERLQRALRAAERGTALLQALPR